MTYRMGGEDHSLYNYAKDNIHLLNYKNHEDFLRSFIDDRDRCYIGNDEALLQIIRLGYRTESSDVDEEKFLKKRALVSKEVSPSYLPYEMSSTQFNPTDPFLVELAKRERANRVGIISTIIHLTVNIDGKCISGYIDYADKLSKQDWKPIFAGKKILIPRVFDLGYYNWRSGKVISNNSFHFQVILSEDGLIFRHRLDRMVINPDPVCLPGRNTIRRKVDSTSSVYEEISILDHYVRQRR